MPEAAMDEDDRPVPWKYEVRRSEETSIIDSKAQASSEQS